MSKYIQLSNDEHIEDLLKIPAPVRMEALRPGDRVRVVGGTCGVIREFKQIDRRTWHALVHLEDFGMELWYNCCDLRRV